MNDAVKKVKLGYSSLDRSEREEVRRFIKEFEDEDFSEKRSINEELRKSLGPINSAECPCCGK